MGMSTHIVGFCPPDDKWKKMKSVIVMPMVNNVNVMRRRNDKRYGSRTA